ncbi:hypothetical protein OBBRIDRAFT_831529 [Obba rivulosa]|uniref:Chromo domain-containing protein n=1 Tax=Obba rivulosa TaxID=1052685 RepID=A0A8E2J4Q0_9APHY|nr:hypothetical protein OBBRIDRAFT_831529 [Obba rivulosa]
MASDEDVLEDSSLEIPSYDTQFISQEDDEETLWEVIEILEERPAKYKVKWAGVDPATGKPWPPSWVPKQDCTDHLVREWKIKQARKKKEALKKKQGKTRSSATSSTGVSKQSIITPKAGPSTALAMDVTKTVPPRKKAKVSVEIVRRPASRSAPSRRSSPPSAHPPDVHGVLEPFLNARSAHSEGRVSDSDEEPDAPGSNRRDKGKHKDAEIMKIGPPRGIKRKRAELSGTRSGLNPRLPAKPAHQVDHEVYMTPSSTRDVHQQRHSPKTPSRQFFPLTAISSQTRHLLRQEEEESTQEALNIMPSPSGRVNSPEALRVHRGYPPSGLNDTHSRDGIVPESQPALTTQDASLNAGLPTTPVRPSDTRPVRSDSSIISQMRRRSGNESSRRTIRETSSTDDAKAGPRKTTKSKPLRPPPTISPSVFRPHLPEPDPPPSSIEQFSSPEKGPQGAARLLIQRAKQRTDAKGKGKAVVSTCDDETLHVRGQTLAAEASSARAEERRRQLQSGRPLRPPKPDLQPSDPPSDQASLPEHPEAVQDDLDVIPDEHLVAQQMVEDYIDFDGGFSQPDHPVVEHARLEHHVSLQPNAPDHNNVPAALPAAEAQEIVTAERRQSVSEQAMRELPSTSSTQRADIGSQSQSQPSNHPQIQALTDALGEKVQEVVQKAAEIDDLRRQNATLVTVVSAATSRQEVQNRALAESETRNSQLVAQVAELQQMLAQEKARAEAANQEQQKIIEDLQRRKHDAESDRDLFKELYDKASAHASEVGEQKTQLQRELSVASGQVTDGLTMIKRMYVGRMQKLQEELVQWKGLCKVLTDKDERTDDEVRRRAAEEPILREENAELREAVEDLQENVARLQTRIQELTQVVPEPEPMTIEPAAPLQPDENAILAQDQSADFAQEAPIRTEEEPSSSADFMRAALHARTFFYVCQYVTDTTMCNTRFPTAEAMKNHAYHVHYPWMVSVLNL